MCEKNSSTPLDKISNLWYNKNVKRGRELKNNAKTQKEKNLKNPLDRPTEMWYNKYASERDKELHFT
jgi:hypothetical protein